MIVSGGTTANSAITPRNASHLARSWEMVRPVASSTGANGLTTSYLLVLTDANSRHQFLIDTGAGVSVIPPSSMDRKTSKTVQSFGQSVVLPLQLSALGPLH